MPARTTHGGIGPAPQRESTRIYLAQSRWSAGKDPIVGTAAHRARLRSEVRPHCRAIASGTLRSSCAGDRTRRRRTAATTSSKLRSRTSWSTFSGRGGGSADRLLPFGGLYPRRLIARLFVMRWPRCVRLSVALLSRRELQQRFKRASFHQRALRKTNTCQGWPTLDRARVRLPQYDADSILRHHELGPGWPQFQHR
jgi:hypothetical protein